jgi:hypothetical protein
MHRFHARPLALRQIKAAGGQAFFIVTRLCNHWRFWSRARPGRERPSFPVLILAAPVILHAYSG